MAEDKKDELQDVENTEAQAAETPEETKAVEAAEETPAEEAKKRSS